MARIVLAVYGSYGDVYPFLAVARSLTAAGHTAVIAAPEKYRSLVEGAGVEFGAVRPDVSEDDTELYRRVMEPKRGPEVLVREVLTPALRDSYRDLDAICEGADLIVSHVLTYSAPIIAERRALPWAGAVLSPMIFMSAHDPPALSTIPAFAKLRVLGPRAVGTLWRLMSKISWSWGEPVRALRKEIGLPPGGDPLWGSLERANIVLALFSESLAPSRPDWPASTVQCGFPFYDHDYGGGASRDRLAAFLDDGEPPIVFTLGSSAVMVEGGFYGVAVEALQRLSHRGVLVTGADVRPSIEDDRILCIESAAVHELFPRARVNVHAGGVGTIGQALRAGRPQLVVPFAHDHFDNARRATLAGCSRVLPKRRLNASRLAAELERILHSSALTDAAERVASTIRTEDGAQRACDALETALTAHLMN